MKLDTEECRAFSDVPSIVTFDFADDLQVPAPAHQGMVSIVTLQGLSLPCQPSHFKISHWLLMRKNLPNIFLTVLQSSFIDSDD